MSEMEEILDAIGTPEALAQLAEEAAELSQAALKYRRVITGKNPTPVTQEEALEKLREEIADVDLCLVAIGELCEEHSQELKRMDDKCARWYKRIREAEEAKKRQKCPDGIAT